LGRGWNERLSKSGIYFEGGYVFFEEALTDELFHVLLEASVVDGLVFLAIMIRAVFFCLGKCEIVLD